MGSKGADSDATDEQSVSDDISEQEEDADGKGRSEDIAAFMNALLSCLDSVDSAGSFSSFQCHSVFPTPGLYVNNEMISLALTARDADALSALKRPSAKAMRLWSTRPCELPGNWTTRSSSFATPSGSNSCTKQCSKQVTTSALMAHQSRSPNTSFYFTLLVRSSRPIRIRRRYLACLERS